MTAPPLPMMYEGEGVFRALPRALEAVMHHYGQGEVVMMAPVEERSEVSHRHEFAWLKTAWETLPDNLAAEFPTTEHLRKRALIETGWCTVQDYACGTRAEALRWLAYLRKVVPEYSVVTVENTVIRVFEARSQARGKMKKEDFQKSKTDILTYVANLLDVPAESLAEAQAA